MVMVVVVIGCIIGIELLATYHLLVEMIVTVAFTRLGSVFIRHQLVQSRPAHRPVHTTTTILAVLTTWVELRQLLFRVLQTHLLLLLMLMLMLTHLNGARHVMFRVALVIRMLGRVLSRILS